MNTCCIQSDVQDTMKITNMKNLAKLIVMDSRKQYILYTSMTHMNSQRLWQHAQILHRKCKMKKSR